MMENLSIQAAGVFLIIVGAFYVLDFICVLLDLRSGVRKAKAAGLYRSSRKYRRTVEKLQQYFGLLTIITVVDVIIVLGVCLLGIHLPIFPYLTFVSSLIVGLIEIKSVFEKTADKDKANIQDAVEDLAKLAKNRDVADLLSGFTQYLQEQQARGGAQ